MRFQCCFRRRGFGGGYSPEPPPGRRSPHRREFVTTLGEVTVVVRSTTDCRVWDRPPPDTRLLSSINLFQQGPRRLGSTSETSGSDLRPRRGTNGSKLGGNLLLYEKEPFHQFYGPITGCLEYFGSKIRRVLWEFRRTI